MRSASGDPAMCVIDCQGTEEDWHRGFHFWQGEGPDSIVEGLTITNGFAGDTAWPYTENSGGGGVYCYASSPTLRDCVISACVAKQFDPVDTFDHFHGGGGVSSVHGSPTLIRCELVGNQHDWWPDRRGDRDWAPAGRGAFTADGPLRLGDDYIAHGGGGMYAYGGEPTLIDCTISDNQAEALGGGVCYDWGALTMIGCSVRENSLEFGSGLGAGIYTGETTLVMTHCTISGNVGTGSPHDGAYGGGAAFCSGSAVLRGCTIAGNVDTDGVQLYGDWSGTTDDESTLIDCLIHGNGTEGQLGDGVFVWGLLDVTLVNCTISANQGNGIVTRPSSGNCDLVNCIVWGNDAGIIAENATVTCEYSNIQGGWPDGVGIIAGPPLFVDPDGPDDDPNTWEDNDYHLSPRSSCINAGNPETVVDPNAVDWDGDPRIIDCRIDIGADEATYLVDCDDNGVSDGCDIADCDGDPSCGDCNLNRVPDGCDIASGVSLDRNGNGIPDECEVCVGDGDCDGRVTWRDIDYFIAAFEGGYDGWESLFTPAAPVCVFENNDCNADGEVDWQDVDPFVAAMGSVCE